jgi:heterodisulfide reductase subunit C
MAALRAKQKLDLPTVQAARLAAKEESARKYCEKCVICSSGWTCTNFFNFRNRNILTLKAAVARSNASWERQCAWEDARWLAMCQRNRLDHALWDIEPDALDQE